MNSPFIVLSKAFSSEGREREKEGRREREMGYSKDQLLACLQGLVRKGKKIYGEKEDKKHRFYVVSAFADTKVDLKETWFGKSRFKNGAWRSTARNTSAHYSREEEYFYLDNYPGHVVSSTHVPLGCVTPFALVNDSARHVSLLMDKGFKDQECCFFHPLLNDTSISAFVPSDAIVLQEDPEKAAPPQVPEKKIVAANNYQKLVIHPTIQKEKSANVKLSSSFTNPEKFIEEILERTSTIVLSEVSRVYAICNFKASSGLGLRKQTIQIKEETIKQHGEQLGTLVSNSIRKHLNLDFINLAHNIKKHSLYGGFSCWYSPPRFEMSLMVSFALIIAKGESSIRALSVFLFLLENPNISNNLMFLPFGERFGKRKGKGV
ncbi:unnamed protein product [Camellia sinensis]